MPIGAVIPAIIGAGGAVAGGLIQNDAANDAQQAQTQAADKALALQGRIYDQQRADLAPYRSAGASALGSLTGLMGLAPSSGGNTPSVLGNLGVASGTRQAVRSPGGSPVSVPAENYTGDFAVPRVPEAMGNQPNGIASLAANSPQAKSASGYVLMRAPDGRVGQIPQGMVDRALAAGGQRVEG